ncbi:hypothetical protein KCP75_07510 [Salmonella enterica subsp. enterica]|nr:hypothetical protein KCP75_07510 [Salmonella enterica subsp. enterica]
MLVEIAQRILEDITDRPIHLTTEDSFRNIISAIPGDQDAGKCRRTPNGMTIFIMRRPRFATGETRAHYNDFADAPKTPANERWPKDSLISEKFHHKPANLAAYRTTPGRLLWILYSRNYGSGSRQTRLWRQIDKFGWR